MQPEKSGFQAAGLHAQRGQIELARPGKAPDKDQEDQYSKGNCVHYRYMPVTARWTKVNTAMIKKRMIAAIFQARPAFDAMPSKPPVPAKNKTT